MQGKPTRFTMVFEGDLREFKGNPLNAVTDWGVPAAVGVGDAFARLDAYEAALREIAAIDMRHPVPAVIAKSIARKALESK